MLSKIGRSAKYYTAKICQTGLSTLVIILGPVAVAGAHFLVSLLLIPNLTAVDFGVFAFAMVLLQLGLGFSDGLLGSPLAVVQARTAPQTFMVFAFINWIYCTIFTAISFIVMLWFADIFTAAVFSIFILVMIFRWFGRSLLLTAGNRKSVSRSDMLYAISLIAALGPIYLITIINLERVVILMVIAAVISTLFLGRQFFDIQLKATRWALFRDFIPIWKNQTRWSVVAVFANAATIESHVFIVTFIAGPASFAPIALAALFFRPTLIGIYALTQTERPKIARIALNDGIYAAKSATKSFITITTALWFFNAILAAVISIWVLQFFMNDSYDISTVRTCVLSLAIVMAVRCVRQPVLTFLHATSQFRTVANITLYVAPLSLFFAAAGLWIAGAAGSILGLLIADMTLLIAMLFYYIRTSDVSGHIEVVK